MDTLGCRAGSCSRGWQFRGVWIHPNLGAPDAEVDLRLDEVRRGWQGAFGVLWRWPWHRRRSRWHRVEVAAVRRPGDIWGPCTRRPISPTSPCNESSHWGGQRYQGEGGVVQGRNFMGVSTGQKLLAPGWAVGGLFGGGRSLVPEPRAWLLPLHPGWRRPPSLWLLFPWTGPSGSLSQSWSVSCEMGTHHVGPEGMCQ